MKRIYENESSGIFVYDFDQNGISGLVDFYSISGLFSMLHGYYVEITTTIGTPVPGLWIITCNMMRIGMGMCGKAMSS